jgi:peroxiredoxin (alkyl hydroperoxide reductase subunit C)
MLVCREAPDFQAAAVLANGQIESQYRLSDRIRGKYALIFFYPLDFTFVCPTELVALSNDAAKFKERNVEIIAVSIDSVFTHQAWRNTPVEKGGIGPVNYTMVSDLKQEITKAYGVADPQEGMSLRGAFLIDDKGIVRSQIVTDKPIGRSVDEIIRLFDAIQFYETHGEVCPANWEKGRVGMKATAEGVAAYMADNA